MPLSADSRKVPLRGISLRLTASRPPWANMAGGFPSESDCRRIDLRGGIHQLWTVKRLAWGLGSAIMTGMADDLPKRRWFYPTPGWLILTLLAVEGLLWLSERFQWLAFNSHKGWTVLIAVASVGVMIVLVLLWLAVALLLRLRFQFSIRLLLVSVLVAALPFSWLAVEMKKAREQKELVSATKNAGGLVKYDWGINPFWDTVPNAEAPGPGWLGKLLGGDFFLHVTVIVFGGRQVTDRELEHLEDLTKLQRLWLNNTAVTDVGVAHLAGLTQLTELRLDSTQITDAGLRHLAGLTRLRWLDLERTRITDAGLLHLSGLTQLQELWLDHTQITDAGLGPIAGLTQLRLLWVMHNKVTDDGVEKLRQALPECQIF